MFKSQDKVKFGDMFGVVLTNTAPTPEFPIQVVFAKQKLVLGFKKDGYFFDFGAGPKLIIVKQSILKKVIKYVINMLWTKRKVG